MFVGLFLFDVERLEAEENSWFNEEERKSQWLTR